MWFLSKIIGIDYDRFYAYPMDSLSMDDIESLVFVNSKTKETRLIPFDNCGSNIKSSVDSITSYISDSLDNEEFVGIYANFLFCINKYELKIADYFDEAGVVIRLYVILVIKLRVILKKIMFSAPSENIQYILQCLGMQFVYMKVRL